MLDLEQCAFQTIEYALSTSTIIRQVSPSISYLSDELNPGKEIANGKAECDHNGQCVNA